MSEPTRKNDIIESGVLDEFIRDVKKAKEGLEKYDAELRKVAQTMKGELESANKQTIQGMEKISRLQKTAEKQVKAKRANQKTLTTLEREEAKLLKQKAQLEAQIQSATSKTAKEVANLRAEKNKINKATRDEIKANERSKDAYSRLVDETRDAKNESKRLGARLRELRKEGKQNEKGFKDLEQQYNATTRDAQTLDAELKDLDKTVGDNFRNVGNYESATNKLTGSLRTLAGAAGLGALVGGLGSVTKQLSVAENQARLFFNTSKEGTKEIAQEATILAKVYDKEVNEVLRAANVLSKQFKIDGPAALELVNQGFEKGGDVSGELLENISEYSTQLRLAGLNAEQSISIITQSQQAGVFSDKGIDAIKEATLSLREMTPPAKEALEAIGMSADQVQKDIASGTKSYFDVIQEVSSKTNEVGENTQAAGMILADVFKGAGEDAGDFIFSLGEMNTSLEDLEDQNKGLEGAIQNITREWYEFVFGVEEGTGAIDKFSGIINFVADNLGAIIKTITRLAALYLIIKARQKIINSGMLDYAKNLFKAKGAQNDLNKSMSKGGGNAKGFGKALKGIGWAALIGVIIEVAVAFYDVASGAAQARKEEELYAKFKKQSDQKINASIERNNKLLEKNLDNIRKRRELGELTEKEALKQSELAAAAAQDRISEEDRLIKKELEKQKLKEKEIEQLIKTKELSATELIAGAISPGASNKELIKLANNLTETRAKIKALTDSEKSLNEEQENLNGTLEEFGHQLEVNNRDKINAHVKGLNDTAEATERLTGAQEWQNIQWGKSAEEIEENNRLLEDYLEHIQKMRDEDDLLTIDESEFGDMLGEAPILPDDEMDEFEDQQKEIVSILNDTQKAITAALTSNIDTRIELLDREANAAKEQQDYLQGLAENGNINAQQSITEEREREIAALREKERLEKQKATLELISSALEVFSTSLEEGASPQEALAQTVLTTGALTEFLSGLNFFAEGTDNAPKGLAVVGEEGPEAQFSKSGKFQGILGQKGAELRNMKGGERILTAPETMDWMKQSAMMNQISPIKQDTAGNSYDLLGKKLDNVERAIKNQPTNDWSVEEAAKNVMNLIKTTKQGGDKRVSKYRVKY